MCYQYKLKFTTRRICTYTISEKDSQRCPATGSKKATHVSRTDMESWSVLERAMEVLIGRDNA